MPQSPPSLTDIIIAVAVSLSPVYIMLARLLWVASKYVTQHQQMYAWWEKTQIRIDTPGHPILGRHHGNQ